MMFKLMLAATAIGLANVPAEAQSRAHPRPGTPPPHLIGRFDEWKAATHQEAGQQVCYAFTRANSSNPALPGRGDVVLTVTQRPGLRDAVAISAGFAYPANAEVTVVVEGTSVPFYTANRSAFAREGRAAVSAFSRGRQAVAKGPGPRVANVTDIFPLRGFNQAYAAINRACPAR